MVKRQFLNLRGVITLCGSTRFKPLFEYANRKLTFKGWTVNSIEGTYTKWEPKKIAKEILKHEKKICRVHKNKIAMGEAILVVDGEEGEVGYTGKHTNREIRFARKHGIKVHYMTKGDLRRLLK